MRIYKQIFLPCELVGMEGESKTAEFKNEGAKSSFRWKYAFDRVPNPSSKTKELWKEFIDWLLQQRITLINNFDNQIIAKY